MATSGQSERRMRALGLMSGSSLDGLDLAYCEFTIISDRGSPRIASWQLGEATTLSYSKDWVSRLENAIHLNGLELTQLHSDFGTLIGDYCRQFIDRHDLQPDLIGSHGHTVFHYPAKGFTLQIGSGAAIAARTGITTVCDFRDLDVAHGGQGAPLAPLADALLLSEHAFYLNLGGIANITARTRKGHIAYDIGGANQILNALVAPLGLPFDDRGALARTGRLIPELAAQQHSLDYFSQDYPKSLDNHWVRKNQTEPFLEYSGATEDKLHTACKLIADQIRKNVLLILDREEVEQPPYSLLVSGGGAYNDFLMECITEALPAVQIEIPEKKLVAFKEAALMGLMGSLRLMGLNNCLSAVTGAAFDVCGGAIHAGRQ